LKVAILGAGGFIGQNLAQKLILDGHDVTSFVRNSRLADPSTLGREIVFDFSKLTGMSELLNSFDAIYHLVSSTNPSKSSNSPRFDAQENLMASLDLMEILKDNPRTRLVFVSSGGTVYGIPQTVPITESHATNPVSFYGVSKLAVEKYLHAYSVNTKLDYVVLRLSNPFGPGQVNNKGQGLIPTIVESAMLDKPLRVWGDGSSVRDYLYIDDAVDGISRVISQQCKTSLFNIGSGFGTSVLELVGHVEEITKKKISLVFKKQRTFDAPANVLDISLAKSELSWTPKTELREGLEATVRWNEMRIGASRL
jgi:UDP-glucose 4-epimerase